MYPGCGNNWTISRNYVVSNYAYGIHVNSSVANATTNFLIERNVIEGRKIPTGVVGTTAGIVITKGYGHIIRNNLIIGQGSAGAKLTMGILVMGGMSGASIFNNTVHDMTNFGIQAQNCSNIQIQNNLLSLIPSKNVYLSSASNVTVMNNLCPTIDPDGGCTVVTTTPGFVRPGSDFHLAAGSRAIDAGATISSVSNDHDGMRRPAGGGYDIGAYEGNSSSATLAPPQNLKVQ
jgi:parallel beta-helix repeat protein